MIKLPKLKTIELPRECRSSIRGGTARVEKAFDDGMIPPLFGDRQAPEGRGVGQLRALLLAADAANLKLETLDAGDLGWQFFRESTKQNAEVMKRLQRALRYVRTLKLYICNTKVDDFSNPIPLFFNLNPRPIPRSVHLNPHLKNFITATPALECLDIGFSQTKDALPPVSLCDSVGAYKWHSLRVAAFTEMRATESCLVEFFDRHAGTLRELRLDDIVLIIGSWPPVFQHARRTLKLEQARVCGSMGSLNPFESFAFDLAAYRNDDRRSLSQVMIERYLVGSGDAPLLDLYRIIRTYGEQYIRPDPDKPLHFDTESDEAKMDCF